MAKAAVCPNCRAPLRVDPRSPVVTCEYCHHDVKQTIFAPPSPPQPAPRPPSSPPPPVQPDLARAGRVLRRWLWISLLLGLAPMLFVGVMTSQRGREVARQLSATVAGAARTAGLSSGVAGSHADEPESDRQLGVKLAPYLECINDHASAFYRARNVYRAWVKASGPTCKERCLARGIPDVSQADQAAGCSERLRAAAELLPDLAELEQTGSSYGRALAALAPAISEAHHYYDQKDYQEDGCEKGRALHGRLQSGFAAFDLGEAQLRAVVDRELAGLLQRRAERAARRGDQLEAATLQVALEAGQLLSQLRATLLDRAAPEPEALRARVKALEQAIQAGHQADARLPESTRQQIRGHFLWPHGFKGWIEGAARELLKVAKTIARDPGAARASLQRRARGRRSIHFHDHPLAPVVRAYDNLQMRMRSFMIAAWPINDEAPCH